jgi:hypothetical protein
MLRFLKRDRRPCPKCPNCGVRYLEVPPPREAPAPGDFTICLHCAAALQFDEAMQLRALPIHVRRELAPRTRSIIERTQYDVRLERLRKKHEN